MHRITRAKARCAVIDPGARANARRDIAVRLKSLEGAHDDSTGQSVAIRELPRCGQAGSGSQSTAQNGRPQLLIEPVSNALAVLAIIQGQLERTNRLCHISRSVLPRVGWDISAQPPPHRCRTACGAVVPAPATVSSCEAFTETVSLLEPPVGEWRHEQESPCTRSTGSTAAGIAGRTVTRLLRPGSRSTPLADSCSRVHWMSRHLRAFEIAKTHIANATSVRSPSPDTLGQHSPEDQGLKPTNISKGSKAAYKWTIRINRTIFDHFRASGGPLTAAAPGCTTCELLTLRPIVVTDRRGVGAHEGPPIQLVSQVRAGRCSKCVGLPGIYSPPERPASATKPFESAVDR